MSELDSFCPVLLPSFSWVPESVWSAPLNWDAVFCVAAEAVTDYGWSRNPVSTISCIFLGAFDMFYINFIAKFPGIVIVHLRLFHHLAALFRLMALKSIVLAVVFSIRSFHHCFQTINMPMKQLVGCIIKKCIFLKRIAKVYPQKFFWKIYMYIKKG